MAEDDAIEDGEGSKLFSGKLKMVILIIVGVLLVAGLSVGATWFLMKDRLPQSNDTGMNDLPMDDPEMSETQGEALYHALQPAFIVNYTTGGRSRFLQVELSVLTRDPAAIEVLILHNPLIRNNLLDVFAAQNVDELVTAAGKQKLADELTEAIQDVLEEEMGRPGIESVLYRSFVMQ